jgi:hypothetical protein
MQANFSATMGSVLTGWAAVVEQAVNVMFNGSDESIAVLTTLISDGAFLEGASFAAPQGIEPDSDTQTAVNAVVTKIFYAFAIPTLWQVSGQAPFVIDSGFPCGTVDPMGGYLDTDTMHKTWACWDNQLYYLAAPTDGPAQTCDGGGDGTAVTCRDNLFGTPKGIDSLDGRSEFGGIKVADLVVG